MTTNLDWEKQRGRDRVARQGGDAISRPRPGAHKAAADAEVITRILKCRCGHRGKIELPMAMLAGKKFRCSKCQRVIGR